MHSTFKPALLAALIAMGAASAVHAQPSAAAPDAAAKTSKSSSKEGVSASDKKLMEQLAQANMAEIAVAELAQTKSSNEQVLKFAKQMRDDHTTALKDLSNLADKKDVKLPKETDAKHKDALKKMNTMNAADFDREYIAKAGIQDHQEAKKLVDKIAADAKDADLKALGKQLQPTIETHLKMAKELKAS